MRRAHKPATRWRLVAAPFALACGLATSYFLSREVVMSQYLFAPADTFYCTPALFVGAAIILISLLVGLSTGFIVVTCIWLVLQLRRTFNEPQTRISQAFYRSIRQVAPIAMILALIGIPILLILVKYLFYQQNDRI